MNGEETTTTLGAVAESQANISTEAPVVEQPAQPEPQPEQPAVADNN